jgi:hypothetical protein
MAYDRADFDYSTSDSPLPKGHAATHIGMFLAWALTKGLENDYHRSKFPELTARLRSRAITGREFFEAACQGKFSERDLSPEGNAFAEVYYRNESGERGPYFEDYRKTLAADLPSFWHVEDTWENYDRIAPVIEKRYQAWKQPASEKRWWQFWK